jgi:hypothetical protein
MTQNGNNNVAEKPAAPASELKLLDVLVGKWVTEMRMIGSPTFSIIGTDIYEWQAGGFFMLHHVDVRMDDEAYTVIEIIGGYDAATKSYPMRSFDSRGEASTMQASIDAKGVWTFAGEKIRATLTVSADRSSMTAQWEQLTDGENWQHWMDMRFTKIS